MKNVLYISYDGMTDPLGQSQVLPYLAGLAQKGYSIHLISFEKADRYQQLSTEIQAFCNHNKIHWYPEWYTATPPIISTVKDIRTTWKRALSIHHQYPIEIVHCRSYISAMAGLMMKKKFDTRFVFDMRGFWADERVDGKIWNLKNPVFKSVYNYFKRKEKEFLREADAVVSLTNRAKTEIVSWNLDAGMENKISVIPCCADLNLFKTNRTQLPNQNPFVLGYIGSIGTWYMLNEMLDFFKVVQSKFPNAEFHFATKEDPKNILEPAKSKGIDEKVFKIQYFKHKEIPAFIETLSASVLFILPSYSKMASCPTKLGELMAMGIPSVCNAGVGDTEEIVTEYQAGAVVTSFDTSAYEKALAALSQFNFERTLQGAQDIFSLENGIEIYHLIYQNL